MKPLILIALGVCLFALTSCPREPEELTFRLKNETNYNLKDLVLEWQIDNKPANINPITFTELAHQATTPYFTSAKIGNQLSIDYRIENNIHHSNSGFMHGFILSEPLTYTYVLYLENAGNPGSLKIRVIQE